MILCVGHLMHWNPRHTLYKLKVIWQAAVPIWMSSSTARGWTKTDNTFLYPWSFFLMLKCAPTITLKNVGAMPDINWIKTKDLSYLNTFCQLFKEIFKIWYLTCSLSIHTNRTYVGFFDDISIAFPTFFVFNDSNVKLIQLRAYFWTWNNSAFRNSINR